MVVDDEDERLEVIKRIETMVSRNHANREKFEKAVFKIAYPLPPIQIEL